MPAFTISIINYLAKYYYINSDEAKEMVNDEWDYIEQEYINGSNTPKDIAKYLISLYMVA
ncbi:hypothetical protein FCU45_10260 [Sulfurimonas crateris]|uniref:Uncharacterized protein n=1 Tax=Sulfurimonas crateris TaxID=2574727 RepID=A0A4U2Z2K8_9BACT|nr:hypothetical protein [Sulfurimonas crateris]TKI68386.1 hypothetical protein FCU45_10260 [Sulfurimonas crateris]